MPELPEVEIMTRNVARWCGHKRLDSLELLDSRLFPQGLDAKVLLGKTASRIRRRAKYLVLELEDQALVFHFRMTGKLIPATADVGNRFRLMMGFEDGTRVGFRDQRCLGTVDLLETRGLEQFFADKGLGPEPWPDLRPGSWWATQLRGLSGPLKPALMRQDKVAGIGNILAAEMCWLAGLSPLRAVPDLSPNDWNAIASAAHKVIERSLAASEGDEIRYVGEGRSSPEENPFSVYGREGTSCPRCTGVIRRDPQAGRSTFWCETCQA